MSITRWQIVNKIGLITETNIRKYLEMKKNKKSCSHSEHKWCHTRQQ